MSRRCSSPWLLMLFAFALLPLITGCANYAFVEAAETSHPLAGRPFGDPSEEDCARRVNAGLGREWPSGWYAEAAAGYKLKRCGFFGPRLTGDVRVGRRFRFGEQQ